MSTFIHRSSIGGLIVSCDASFDGCERHFHSEEDIPVGTEAVYAVPSYASNTTGYCWEWSGYGSPYQLEIPDDTLVCAGIACLEHVTCAAKEVPAVLKALRVKHQHVGPTMEGCSYEALIPLSSVVNVSEEEKQEAIARMRRFVSVERQWREHGGDLFTYSLADSARLFGRKEAVSEIMLPSGKTVHCLASAVLDNIVLLLNKKALRKG